MARISSLSHKIRQHTKKYGAVINMVVHQVHKICGGDGCIDPIQFHNHTLRRIAEVERNKRSFRFHGENSIGGVNQARENETNNNNNSQKQSRDVSLEAFGNELEADADEGMKILRMLETSGGGDCNVADDDTDLEHTNTRSDDGVVWEPAPDLPEPASGFTHTSTANSANWFQSHQTISAASIQSQMLGLQQPQINSLQQAQNNPLQQASTFQHQILALQQQMQLQQQLQQQLRQQQLQHIINRQQIMLQQQQQQALATAVTNNTTPNQPSQKKHRVRKWDVQS
eukprot:c10575_g2_i1.p1 GENE.c10575_g2_i1~~c10575_g2_i1.p1  ORF type:complete len:285 (-),score=71.68 c10575_g2_i1:27-881(-)